MAIQPSQYNSFLGGEVSPLLWHRADMSQFGKWFANAENIRFTTMGSFSNRPGFKRLGPVLDSQFKPVVKLIPFVFNNEEVFEIEFITGKFRVRKNGEVIIREDGSEVVYDSQIKIESLQQLKYAQSGDIIFIASGTSPVMELRRLKTDGTEWELVEFSGEITPLAEENEDKENTISINKKTSEDNLYKRYIFKMNPITERVAILPQIILNSGEIIGLNTVSADSLQDLAKELSRTSTNSCGYYGLSFAAGETGDFLYVYTKKEDVGIKSLILKKDTYSKKKQLSIEYLSYLPSFTTPADSAGGAVKYSHCYKYRIPMIGDGLFPQFIQPFYEKYEDGSYIYYEHQRYYLQQTGNKLIYPKNIQESIDLINNYGSIKKPNQLQMFYVSEVAEDGSYYDVVTQTPRKIGDKEIRAPILEVLYGKEVIGSQEVFDFENEKYKNVAGGQYKAYFDKNTELQVGNIFAIKNSVNSGEIAIRVETGRILEKNEQGTMVEKTTTIGNLYTSKTVIGNGKWRFYTSGNWTGVIDIWYAKSEKDDWKLLRTTSSDGVKDPGIFNENTSGTIETNETVLFKVTTKISAIGTEGGMGPLNIHFFTDSFDTNSYYKVEAVKTEKEYFVSCLKNDIGEIKQNPHWRMSAFSLLNGYPESVGFYQNRLFFSKGYELWGSKINDYWDFYEPIELKKDDPINISILSYKVNTIKNILTTKSFFVFTTGGEFGIASQGAISQDDKFLKQFSSHGSNNCQPILVGNLVLFVDSTENTIRAFQYSFESDSYEATDISLFIEEKLRGKKIVTTEYIKSTKECLFLDEDGVIWVFKYMPEQNIMSWSHWKHGRHKITNICVAPHGAYDELYVVVDAPDGKYMEKLDDSVYSDSVESFSFNEEVSEVQTKLVEGDIVNVNDGINNKYKVVVGQYGKIKLRSPSKNVKIGLSYLSVGTLLTPILQIQNNTYTTYNKTKPFKVHFRYKDSFGFKVGVEEEEKMEVDFVEPHMDIEEATALTTGKKSVLIPSRYDGTGRVSFVQDEPYPMLVENVYLEVDYGGK